MAIVAELRFSAPDLFLGDASRAAPDVAVHVEHQAGVAGLLFSAIGDDLDAFERALADDPTIEGHRLVYAVADAVGVDPLSIEPVYDSVDPDALEALIRGGANDLAVSFDHDGVPVEVYGDGTVRIVAGTVG